MTQYTFTGEAPLFYPMLADFPAEGEAQNLEVKQGDVVDFADRQPPPGPWAELEGKPKTKKVTE
jgi:hypothetical protein